MKDKDNRENEFIDKKVSVNSVVKVPEMQTLYLVGGGDDKHFLRELENSKVKAELETDYLFN